MFDSAFLSRISHGDSDHFYKVMQLMKAIFTTREVGSTNVPLGHSPSGTTSKKLNEEEALLDCFNRSWIQDFGNAADSALGLSQNLMV